MSYFIRIFCQSSESVSRRDIAEFIVGGLHFDHMIEFWPAFNDPESMRDDWETLNIIYDADRLAVNLLRNEEPTVVMAQGDAVKDFIGTLAAPSELQRHLIEMVDGTTQLMTIEIDRDGLSEEAWAMLDALESYLAGNLMGLVYAPDDGFYGSGLELLHKIG